MMEVNDSFPSEFVSLTIRARHSPTTLITSGWNRRECTEGDTSADDPPADVSRRIFTEMRTRDL
jgi:hypothetical protein